MAQSAAGQADSFPCARSDAITNVITIHSFSKNARCLSCADTPTSANNALLGQVPAKTVENPQTWTGRRPLRALSGTLLGQVPAKIAENPSTWIGRRPLSALWGTHLVQVPAKIAENPLTWTGRRPLRALSGTLLGQVPGKDVFW